MKNLNLGKKGELTTKQIVSVIILVASFIIILFFIFNLGLEGKSEKEICRNSVTLRDKSSSLSGPVDCKTNYICISGGKKCGELSKETIKIDSKNKGELMKTIADEMSNCWWQFGEGKMNYGSTVSGSTKYALCSIIEFDEEIQKTFSEISYNEFYNFLKTTNKENSQTYLNYLYKVNDLPLVEITSEIKIDLGKDKIFTNQKYSILTGIKDYYVSSDDILKVYIIPTSETSSRIESGEFITKA